MKNSVLLDGEESSVDVNNQERRGNVNHMVVHKSNRALGIKLPHGDRS